MFINGKIVHSVINQNPEIFHDVKFYASNPWTTASKAVIKDFRLATFNHQGKHHFDNIMTFGKSHNIKVILTSLL